MKAKTQMRTLTCTADGYVYEIAGDERNLYFDKIGREGVENDGVIQGSVRVVKSQVEAVRCMRVRGKTVILIVFEGKTSRLTVQGTVKEDLLMKIFSGVPLKLSINYHSTVLTEQYELWLLAACFIVTILRVLCYFMQEVRAFSQLVALGWIVIPFMWLIPCAGRMLKGGLRDQFPVGGGMLATVFSCIFLWASSARGVDNWASLVIPSVIGAAIVGITYFVSRGNSDFKSMAVVMLIALICFSPAASLALNRMLPAWSEEVVNAEVVQLERELFYGNSRYYVNLDVEVDGQSRFEVMGEFYRGLEQGDSVRVVSRTGLMGIPYTSLECDA